MPTGKRSSVRMRQPVRLKSLMRPRSRDAILTRKITAVVSTASRDVSRRSRRSGFACGGLSTCVFSADSMAITACIPEKSVPSSLFPGIYWNRLHSFTALQAVINVKVAGGSQRLVVEINVAGQLLQLFAEPVNRMQLAGCCRKLILGRFDELLMASVQQPGHPAPNQHSRMHGEGNRRRFICRSHQNCPGPMLAHQHAACDFVCGRHIEGVRAQLLQNLLKVRFAGLSSQGGLPVCEDMKLLSAESSRICNLAYPISHTRSAHRNSHQGRGFAGKGKPHLRIGL